MYKIQCKFITNFLTFQFVHCTQTNHSIVNYFEDQRYQSFKSKNIDSKYKQNVSCRVKGDEKEHANIYSKYSRKMVYQNKRKSTENVTMKGKKAIQKVKSKKEGKNI